MKLKDDDYFKLDNKNLVRLLSAFQGKIPSVKIGIPAGKPRKDSTETNAEIGAKHEFGDPTAKPPLPIRSFLRVPIATYFEEALEKKGAFNEETIKKIIDEKSLEEFVRKFGETALEIVLEAFATGGFGHWKPSNMAFKKNHQTLVEEGHLMKSVTYVVEE